MLYEELNRGEVVSCRDAQRRLRMWEEVNKKGVTRLSEKLVGVEEPLTTKKVGVLSEDEDDCEEV
jgi:hypothetical protein